MAGVAGKWDHTDIIRLENVLADSGQALPLVIERVQKIATERPDFLPARRTLARILRHTNQHEKAAYIELEAIAHGLNRPGFMEAQQAFLAEETEQAEKAIRRHLQQDPEDPAGALLLGEIASLSNARAEAETFFKRSILLAPSYVEPRIALAKLQRDQGRYDDALRSISDLLKVKHDHLPALSLRAALYEQMRHFDEADAAFEELHRLHPDDARGWANHAFLLKTVGRQDDAVSAYRRAVELQPASGLAWWGLSNLKTVRLSDGDIATIRHALTRDDLDPDDRIHLNYALGKALDDNKDYAGAFAAYSSGAVSRLQQVPYDPQRVHDHIQKSISVCTTPFFADRQGWGSQAADPIFIVSLPRSGSTLVEQILASHPAIEGTEELHDIERIALSLAPQGGTGGWLDALPGMSQHQAQQLGDHYIEATRRFRRTGRPFFTDKMPSNWVFLGLIHSILPNAKIIDIRRHPMGCGFANFSQHFNWGINFSYNLDHIAQFYTEYVRQLAHFEAVLPGRVHHLSYESLVEDTESEVRRLLDYLELPFDETCMRFFENRRAVYTPSSEQVRSPINRDGMERWKNYESFLAPLKQSLGSVLEHYPESPPDLRPL